MAKRTTPESTGLSGKIGGLAVRHMMREVEQRMAAGAQVSAGPTSPEEEEHLQKIRAANGRSGTQG